MSRFECLRHQAITGPVNLATITGNTIVGPLSATGDNTYFAGSGSTHGRASSGT
jgi:hypothetical protein